MSAPPLFIMQCEDDDETPFENFKRAQARCAELGVACEAHASAHGGHGFMKPREAVAEQWPEQATVFLKTHLHCS